MVHPTRPGVATSTTSSSSTTTPTPKADPSPGPTATWNLGALCRFHHRLKTHSAWHYEMTAPGVFVWTSPHGHRYRRDHQGTTAIEPDDDGLVTRARAPSSTSKDPRPAFHASADHDPAPHPASHQPAGPQARPGALVVVMGLEPVAHVPSWLTDGVPDRLRSELVDPRHHLGVETCAQGVEAVDQE